MKNIIKKSLITLCFLFSMICIVGCKKEVTFTIDCPNTLYVTQIEDVSGVSSKNEQLNIKSLNNDFNKVDNSEPSDSASVNHLSLTKFQYQNEVVYDKNNRNKLLAIGEIGLDYHMGKENKDKQIEMFESQIKLAKKYNLPIIIHNRDASGDILEVLKRNAPFEKGGIIHCFSASLEWAREVIKLGFYISFSGTVTFKNAINIQEVAKLVPEDKLLVETDSPYLAPVPHRGEINQPMYLVDVAKFIAQLRNCKKKLFTF